MESRGDGDERVERCNIEAHSSMFVDIDLLGARGLRKGSSRDTGMHGFRKDSRASSRTLSVSKSERLLLLAACRLPST